MSATIETLLMTAEEYLKIPEGGRLTELVHGRVVELNRPFTSHGYFCGQIAFLLMQHVKQHSLGRVVTNDAGVVAQRAPDTVRAPNVAFYCYQRVHLFSADRETVVLNASDLFTVPDVLPGFSVPVRQLFE